VPTTLPALTDLAGRIGTDTAPWSLVHKRFQSWIERPGLRETLGAHLRGLPPDEAQAVKLRSRETTTHFAWCLRDRPDEAFTFWLHEYKPQRDWLPGYADSVHNHRYHFCTTILSGGYRHERYDAHVNPDLALVTEVRLTCGDFFASGASGYLLADEFHRIPQASDGTMTFLVKSRPVATSSLSFDPATGLGHRHVPVEARLTALAERL
jgi:hypothetical protein